MWEPISKLFRWLRSMGNIKKLRVGGFSAPGGGRPEKGFFHISRAKFPTRKVVGKCQMCIAPARGDELYTTVVFVHLHDDALSQFELLNYSINTYDQFFLHTFYICIKSTIGYVTLQLFFMYMLLETILGTFSTYILHTHQVYHGVHDPGIFKLDHLQSTKPIFAI